jgi:hypothetical protein
MFAEQLALRPPGAGDADRSSRGKQKQQARVALILIEPGAELFELLQIGECRLRVGGRGRPGEGAEQNPR